MILKELADYLKKPRASIVQGTYNSQSVKPLLVLFAVAYGLKTTWLLTVNKYLRNHFDISRSEIVETGDDSIWFFFLSAVILYPIVEEFIFRYFLGKKTLTLIVLCIFSTVFGLWGSKFLAIEQAVLKRIVMLIVGILPSVLLLLAYFELRKKGRLDRFYQRMFPALFYFSVLAFALLHIFNFTLSGNGWLAIPLMVPFIISGAVLGFARMKFGMLGNISLHVAFNLTTFILDKGFDL